MAEETVVDTAKEQLAETVQEGYNLAEMAKNFMERYGFNILAGILIFLVGIFIAKKIKALSGKMMAKSKIDNSAVSFLSQIIYFVLLVIISISALGTMGFPTNSFVAAVGGFGIALGLALQGNLSNLASGILILIFKPFRVGEFIEGSGVSGTVQEIQIMSTILYTLDMKKVIIPNSKLTSENVTNFSFSDKRRVMFRLDIDYLADHKKAMALIKEIFHKDPQILQDPEPLVVINEIVDHRVGILAVPWVKNQDYWDVYYRVMEQVKEAFDREGIGRPVQKVLHIRETDS